MTLWNHTLACTSRNRLAHHALGNTFQDLGEFDKAIEQYQAAIAIEPDYVMSHYNLAVALAAVGRLNEAIEHYRITVDLDPDNALAHNNLGNALSMQGRLEEAMLRLPGSVENRSAIRRGPLQRRRHLELSWPCR